MGDNKAAEDLLKKLRRLKENAHCPNCGTAAPQGIGFGNICVKFKTFVCDLCKTSHQAISHRVKSVSMSTWTMAEVEQLQRGNLGGNRVALHVWLQRAPNVGCKYPGGARPKAGDKIETFKQFITDCYESGMFRATTPYEDEGEGGLEGPQSGTDSDVRSHAREARAERAERAERTERVQPISSSHDVTSPVARGPALVRVGARKPAVAEVNLLGDDVPSFAPTAGNSSGSGGGGGRADALDFLSSTAAPDPFNSVFDTRVAFDPFGSSAPFAPSAAPASTFASVSAPDPFGLATLQPASASPAAGAGVGVMRPAPLNMSMGGMGGMVGTNGLGGIALQANAISTMSSPMRAGSGMGRGGAPMGAMGGMGGVAPMGGMGGMGGMPMGGMPMGGMAPMGGMPPMGGMAPMGGMGGMGGMPMGGMAPMGGMGGMGGMPPMGGMAPMGMQPQMYGGAMAGMNGLGMGMQPMQPMLQQQPMMAPLQPPMGGMGGGMGVMNGGVGKTASFAIGAMPVMLNQPVAGAPPGQRKGPDSFDFVSAHMRG